MKHTSTRKAAARLGGCALALLLAVCVIAGIGGGNNWAYATGDAPTSSLKLEVVPPVTVTLSGTKTLIGRDMMAHEFAFGLTQVSGPNMTSEADATKYVALAIVEKDAKDGEAETFTFTPLTLSQEGTYTYKMVELPGYNGTIRYDSHAVDVQIVVTKDASTGELSAKATYLSEPNFVNTVATGIDVELNAEKTFYGGEMTARQFSFTVTPKEQYTTVYAYMNEKDRSDSDLLIKKGYSGYYDEAEANLTRSGWTDWPYSTYVLKGDSVSGPAGTAGEPVSFSLGTYIFTEPGTYEFLIKEWQSIDETITYDTSEWTATVTIAEEGGQLVNEGVTYTKSGTNEVKDCASFVNYTGVKVVISGTKTLTGRPMDADEFSFSLTEPEFTSSMQNLSIHTKSTSGYAGGMNSTDGSLNTIPDVVSGSLTTAPAAAEGEAATFSFEPLYLTQAGTYTCTLREIEGRNPAVTYDDTYYDVEITVTETDTGLQASVAYYKNGNKDEKVAVPTFANTGTSVDVTLQADKTLIGRDMEDQEFRFRLRELSVALFENVRDGKLISESSNVLPQADGPETEAEEVASDTLLGYAAAAKDGEASAIDFGPLTFVAPGDYTYYLTEDEGTDPTVTYDPTKYIVTVTVRKIESGDLYASVTYTKIGATEEENEVVEKASFVNQGQPKGPEPQKVSEEPEEPTPTPVTPVTPVTPTPKEEKKEEPKEEPKDEETTTEEPPEEPSEEPSEEPVEEPEEPESVPVTTSDETPVVLDALPDPNAPDSPEFVTIMEDGVPLTYKKVVDPDTGELVYVLITEEEAPEGAADVAEEFPDAVLWDDTPYTGDETNNTRWYVLLCAAAFGVLGCTCLLIPKKRRH
jgi:pilin isopeptide linkage protein